MDGLGNAFACDVFGTDGFLIAASFAPNGASAPLATSNRTPPGLVWAVARTGVGLFAVTLDPSLTLPDLPFCLFSRPQCDVFANWFETVTVGEYNRLTRTQTIQCHRGGIAQEVAVGAGARVNWFLQLRNSTSR